MKYVLLQDAQPSELSLFIIRKVACKRLWRHKTPGSQKLSEPLDLAWS